MSWRFIFAILLVAAGASAWGGLKLGDWLVAHGPVAPAPPAHPELSNVPVLDANGLPYTARPPQPLVNGTLGVPAQASQTKWQLPDTSIDDMTSNPAIHVATTKITMDEARMLAEGGQGGLSGIADVGALGMPGDSGANQPLQPVEMAPPPPPPAPTANSQAWQASLRQDLQACSAKSFFDRPSCAWSARNKYCEPNKAWGRVPDCPAKSF
ncbi:hypothetical protein ERE07_17120 [Allopusillimonas ginsengisoli]|nr:hypothetical protein [Allopusillimonas ginsengisoli]TEA77099.1 hypothetical protein ERE07_17120 [Allopusillimonas ginsengisoli]